MAIKQYTVVHLCLRAQTQIRFAFHITTTRRTMHKLYRSVTNLFTAFSLFTLQTFIEGGNEASNDNECILTEIKSHLSIASQIIETATEKIPKGKIVTESGNETSGSYECTFTGIKSHLRIASQIIETAKQKIPEDLKELCKGFIGNEVDNVTNETAATSTSVTRATSTSAAAATSTSATTATYTPATAATSTSATTATSTPATAAALDCSDIYLSGERRDGIYTIWPRSETFTRSLRVYCDMESNGGGWTVFQHRGDYGSPEDYFYRDWHDYKIGFGDMMKDFWLGNDNLFALTNQRLYQLRVNLSDWEGNSAYAVYEEFSISDERQNYTLHFSGYSGTAGDSLKRQNGQMFTTKDSKNRENHYFSNCAVTFKGAWWYEDCMDSNLNGLYLRGETSKFGEGVVWEKFKGFYYSLKETSMKIRPTNFKDMSN